jgi:alcohol dehydrogenase class IV
MSRFRWPDGERLIVFGRGELANAADTLGPPGYALLTTSRAVASAPAIAERAGSVHEVSDGRVDELAAALRSQVRDELIVALGGGRVIDTAKALAAAEPPRRVAAIPTTLSGAEMTPVHQHATGVAPDAPRVRPAIVINDPALCASQPPDQLAQSAANALGHAVDGPMTHLRSPVTTLAALDSARLLARAFAPGAMADAPGAARDAALDELALGALLAGYVIGSTWYGLHHVLSQTLRRFAGLGHGEANAIMLPQTIGAIARRDPAWIERMQGAIGEPPAQFAARLRDLGGRHSLHEAGVDQATLEVCVANALTRQELGFNTPPADEQEIRALYAAAF